jgi:hypothetical protein
LALLNHLTLPVIRIVLFLPCYSRRLPAAVSPSRPVPPKPPSGEGGRNWDIKKDREFAASAYGTVLGAGAMVRALSR